MSSIKIARVVTVPEAFVHFKPTLRLLINKGVDLTLISSSGVYEKVIHEELGQKIEPIEISREISPLKDLKSLFALALFFKKNKFDIIHSSTPKAGLLSALAGIFSPRSIRLHTFTGQRWANMNGLGRYFLKFLDKLIIKVNTQCYADSPSQIEFLIHEGVAKPGQIKCLHKGSYGGVDCQRFNNDRFPNAKVEILNELKLPMDSFIVLFVGQISHDKGVDELVSAFKQAQNKNSKLKLLLIGVYREGIDKLEPLTLSEIKSNPDIFSLGYQTQPEKYFSAADLFCLPSHREGFGTVVLEAAACGLPTLGTRIPGLVDAVVDGQTGVLVELKNVTDLTQAILDLANNEQKRKTLGEYAKKRAQTDFDSGLISDIQWREYQILIGQNKFR